MQVSINVICECGAKMTVTPPAAIHKSQKKFDMNCWYCEGLIGSFAVNIGRSVEEGDNQ
ncbi:hypothetical protein [Paenibacillus odorifer]|uniref:hypothetical protein n=1 Tax=Paenibacillus odorifer TaxID=189426 RepID=UPI0015C3F9DA|nr:hypothetical protein [Paenibacillus odorifer]